MKKLICICLTLLLLAGCAGEPEPFQPPEVTGSVSLRYLPGGTLVRCNGETILIDCGTSMTAETLQQENVQSLSAVYLTGSGESRTGGLEDLLAQYPATVYGPGENTPEERTLVDCAVLTVLLTEEDALALRLDFGESSFLFTGNLSTEGQKALASAGTADVLQPGSEMVLTEELAAAVQPTYGILRGNLLPETVDTLQQADAQVYTIENMGPITVESEGSGLQVSWSFHVSDSIAS